MIPKRVWFLTPMMLLAGCAGVGPAPTIKAEQVRVYAPDELATLRYERVKHLRVRSGSAAIRIPGYATAARGIAVLQAEAARLGANGLTNVNCRNTGDAVEDKSVGTAEPAFTCDGDAVRVANGG